MRWSGGPGGQGLAGAKGVHGDNGFPAAHVVQVDPVVGLVRGVSGQAGFVGS